MPYLTGLSNISMLLESFIVFYQEKSQFHLFILTAKYVDWSKRLDSSFPKPLGNICKWLCDAERLLQAPPIPPMAELEDVKASFLRHQVC